MVTCVVILVVIFGGNACALMHLLPLRAIRVSPTNNAITSNITHEYHHHGIPTHYSPSKSIVSPLLSRNLQFWLRAIQIYSSYKTFQLHKVINPNSRYDWEYIHDINSKRMLKLCLDLRGFYLKTGQFLGTRHDFMPKQYIKLLSTLQDSVPPLKGKEVLQLIEDELISSHSITDLGNTSMVDKYFSYMNLKNPIGSASIAQVHYGIWKPTNEEVAIKIQYPNAERLMVNDLKNLRNLAEFLQRTELKFDLLSAIKELQNQIKNEFDFIREANNMNAIRPQLLALVPQVNMPTAIYASKRLLVMSYIEGINLTQLKEYKYVNKIQNNVVKQRIGYKLMNVLASCWGEMLFSIKIMHSDPHPGNICLPIGNKNKKDHRIGILDWGQVKIISDKLLHSYSLMIEAINSNNPNNITEAFFNLGVKVSNPNDREIIPKLAVTMLDTKVVPGYIIDPFDSNNALKTNAVTYMPSDLYFLIRTIQIFRGICAGFEIDYSLAGAWSKHARDVLKG